MRSYIPCACDFPISTSLHLMAFLNFQGDNVVVFSLRRDKLAMNRPNRNTVVFMRTVAHT